MLLPGEILRGKYRLDAVIGRGGMGQVFAATDLEGGHEVAVKIVSRHFVDDVLMARLHREALAAARIRSDYVPRLLEVAETEDGETFLVMERLVGESLSAHLRERGALPWADVARVGEDVLRGLIDAHTAGIVHRDLKPSNVFLAQKDGRVRAMILDFGVCKMDTVDKERLTTTGESIGTVAYMAPEQIRGAAKVDDRADLYAFGVMVFEMLTGRLPHEGPSQMAILASKLENAPARLTAHAKVPIPEGLADVVSRALAREPEARFATAQELLKAWRKVLPAPTLAVGAHTDEAPAPAPPEDEPQPTQTALTAGTNMRRAPSSKIAVALAGGGLFAGAVVIAIAFTRGPDPAPAVAAPPPAVSESAAVVVDPPPPLASSVATSTPPSATRPSPARKPIRPPATTSRPAVSSGPHITPQPRY